MPTPDAWHDQGWSDQPEDTWTDAWGNRHLYNPDTDPDWGPDEPPDPAPEPKRTNGWFGGDLYDEYEKSQKDPNYRPKKFDDGQEKRGLFPLFPEKQPEGRSIFHRRRRYDETR